VAHAVDFCPGLRARSSLRGRRGCAYGVSAGGCVEGNIRVEREDLSANFLEEIKRPLRNWDLVGRALRTLVERGARGKQEYRPRREPACFA